MKVKSKSEVVQSCPTLSDPMDCSLPGSSVHGIFQARVLEWGAIAFSADSGLYDFKSEAFSTIPHCFTKQTGKGRENKFKGIKCKQSKKLEEELPAGF